ncbi:MAG: DUF3656 domain-containing protein [Clostridiaceae bacterium]
MDSLKAGIYGGCDAIYLGGPKFSARAYASNFTDEDLKQVIEYAHTYDVKIYITINTLIKDSEIKEAYEYAVKVWNMGVDAIIIQDPGLISLIHNNNPKIELHASTQMTVHNKLSAEYYVANGLKRIVLSRELSLEEIKDISDDIETEIFIHGALCISYSGKCLMSSMLGGRSGNRGRCAQNCRMHYELLDESDKSVANGYLMSPKDLSTLDIMDAVLNTGTSSLKIEGRMKRREYVYEAVNQYRKAIDGDTVNDKGLKQLFNREGFNHAFMLGNDGKDMMAFKSPKNTGLFLGKVIKGSVVLEEDIALGDGIKNGDSGFILTKLIYNGNPVKSALKGMKVSLFPKDYHDNDVLYKTSDSELLKIIDKKLNEKFPKKHGLTMEVTFNPDKPFNLKTSFRNTNSEVTGNNPELPINGPLSKDRIEASLSKTGDTSFTVDEVIFSDFEDGYYRIAEINELRRALIEKLQESFKTVERTEIPASLNGFKNNFESNERPENLKLIVISTRDQLKAFSEVNDGTLIPVFYPFHRYKGSIAFNDVKDYDNSGKPYMLKCPEIIKTELNTVTGLIDSLKNIGGLLTDNPAMFRLYGDKLRIVGDYKLNILNSYSKYYYKEPEYFTLSQELNGNEIRGISGKVNFVAVLYGRTELMISEYCPVGSTVGGRAHGVECSVPCRNMAYSLKDDKGESFPVMTDIFCRSYIMNSKPVNNLDLLDEYRRMGINSFRADLTNENYDEAKAVIEGLKTEVSVKLTGYTRGHYKRGID